MPALEIPRHHDGRPSLGHVNLMVDTFIANATADDLRSIARNILATGPPGIAAVFSNAARQRLRQTSTKAYPCPHSLFLSDSLEQSAVPSPQLHQTLMKARSMYGAGLGFASLDLLTSVARATIGLRWEDDGDMAQTLALIDSDISQAIQSSKEEIQAGRVDDLPSARSTREALRHVVQECLNDVKSWGGEFPFERAQASLECWKF